MPNSTFRIQKLHKEDIPAVLEIERQSYPHPWTAEQFIQELDNPIATVFLLWQDKQLAGYLCAWLIAGELQILNVATAPQFRRQGVAGRLLSYLFDVCRQQGLERAWLEVRVGNQAAIKLYENQGFVADTIRSRYYRDGEDALLMVRNFDTDSAGSKSGIES